MRIGSREIRVERRPSLSGWQAARISILAIITALLLFSIIFILGDVNPLTAYRETISYAFFNPFGLPLTMSRFIFLLLCTYAFIIPYRAGLWNIGMTGQLYIGSIAVFAVLLLFGGKNARSEDVTPLLVIPLMVLAAMAGGAVFAGIAGFLRGKYNINEIVVTMILNFVAFWLVAFMIKEGGPLMGGGGEGESYSLPAALNGPLIDGIPYTILFALALAGLLWFLFAKTKLGYEIKTYGKNPAAARYAGINDFRIPVLVFLMGGALAGLAGYHYFAAVPGVYKISVNYGYFGDLAFYGIICGLISLGNPLAAIPVALLFGGLSVGGRFVQGKLHLAFGIDYALLGVLMITLVGFQFFYRYQIVAVKIEEESIDVGIPIQES
ncbi:MAG: ABC transporter permease [Caldilineales bacterium]|nr:ABC transporter permease [Caldilineales bacterium]